MMQAWTRRFAAWRGRHPTVLWLVFMICCIGSAGILVMPRLVPGASWALVIALLGTLFLIAALFLLVGLDAAQLPIQLRRVGFGALGLVMIALGVEGALRIVLFQQRNILTSKQGIYYVGAEPLESSGPFGDLAPGESVWLISDLRPYTVVVNRQGLRHLEDVNPQAFRILAVGDSFTFGPYVANEDTWPALLETELRNTYPRSSIQVLNAGIAGYGIVQEMSYLKEKGLALHPDLIILAFFPNDLDEMQPERQQLFERPTRKSWDALVWLTRHSVLFHEFRSLIVKRAFERTRKRAVAVRDASPSEARTDAHLAGYRQQFLELVTLVRKAGIPLVIVAFPEVGQVPLSRCADAPQRFVERLSSEANVPFLDLLQPFRKHQIEELYLFRYNASLPLATDGCFPEAPRYLGDAHLARFGYQVAAQTIAHRLISSELIPQRETGAP